MRLIEAERLEKTLATAIDMQMLMAVAIGIEGEEYVKAEIKAYSDILQGIKETPTAELKPRNGKWVRNEYGITSCSECGGTRRDNRIAYIGWCNKCGAKMEG